MSTNMSVHEYESLLPHVNDVTIDTVNAEGDNENREKSTPQFYFCIPLSWIGANRVTMDNTPFATVILLLNNMIGSGILVQAYVFRETGIVLALFEYILVGLMTYTGIDLMIRSAEHEQIFGFSELAEKALGRYGAIAVDTSIAVGMFGAILSYIIIIGSLSESIMLTFMSPHWYTTSTFWSIGLVGTFVLPMSCIRHFGHLAIVSYASIITIGLTMMLVLIVGTLSFRSNQSDSVNYGSTVGAFDMIGTVVFAFNFCSAIFHAYEGIRVEDRNVKTFQGITQLTTFLGVSVSFVFGLVGYLSFRSDTDVDILTNFTGIVGTVFKLIFVIHLVLYIPGDYVIMRHSGFKVCGCDASTVDEFSFFTTTLLVLGTATFLSCLIQIFLSTSYSLALVLGLTGGIANSIFCFIIPALLAITLIPHDQNAFISALVLLVFGCSIPFLVIASIVMQFSPQ